MFLRSFDLNGFKSFKDKIKLEFKEGITTIVGPNGSGKSNIADAFRWVLGEQKIKTLRGTKGEDVIFGGTKTHKPLGVASVHLNINNDQNYLNLPYEEISIARRIYRSGESDYMINGNSCRLKDIHELFNDTGLGKDSFSIIGQGEIEKILNVKAEERRGIIEELAGIVKYRNRKEKSIKKIEFAEINLRRVLDIIEELHGSYDYLEDSAKKAEYYLQIKNEADDLELKLIIDDIYKSDEGLKTFNKDIDEIKNKNFALSNKLKEKEVKYEKNNLLLLNLENDLKFSREKILKLKDRLNEIKTSSITKENFIGNNREKALNLQEELREIKNKKVNLEALYEDKLKQKNKLSLIKVEKKDLIKDLEIKASKTAQLKNDLLEVGEDIHYALIDIFQDIAVLHNELKSIDIESENLKNKAKNNIKEKEGVLTLKDNLSFKLKEKYSLRDEINSSLLKIQGEISDLKTEKEKLEKEKNNIIEKQKDIRLEYQNKYFHYKALSEIQKEYQGYYKGVKAVLQQRDKNLSTGVIGVVGELIRVDRKYEKSIEVALGASLQDIVVKNTKAAKKDIEFLKINKKGRGTFLPLDVVKARTLKKEYEYLLDEKGVCGIASGFINIKKEYKGVIDNLLGNILIVENLDIGEEIAKKTNQGLKLVTLEGDIFNPGGSLTGGNTGNVNSILARNRNIEELKNLVDKLKVKMHKNEEHTDKINCKLYPLEGKINARYIKEKEYTDKLIGINQDIELRKQELNNLEEKLLYMDYSVDNINEEIEGILKEKEILTIKLKEKKEEKDKLEISKLGKEKEARKIDLKIEKINNKITIEKIALTSLTEKENAFNENLKAYYLEQEDNAILINRKKTFIEETSKINLDLKEDLELLNAEYIEVENEYKEINNLALTRDSKKDELTTINLELKKNIKDLSEEIKIYEENEHFLEVNWAKLDTERSNKVILLQDKFGLLPYEAMVLRKDLEDRKEAQKKLIELQNSVNRLSGVNIGAIEEFARVKERLEFLLKQEGDLRNSITSLEGIIRDIDKIMKERFSKSFRELNKAFQETYSSLFNGGEAYLKLTDKDDILISGIEIYSKPPGKTPKNMSMLSGGERALTALAILFSLLKIKPSPLCIIDEVDASLDESNVANFANYLKNYSDKTQFIVISHRQGTIEESDNLYGVTMNKSGISKIISVSLKNKRRSVNA